MAGSIITPSSTPARLPSIPHTNVPIRSASRGLGSGGRWTAGRIPVPLPHPEHRDLSPLPPSRGCGLIMGLGSALPPLCGFSLLPLPSPECLVLKRIIYQIIFIQLWRRRKKDDRGGKGPFAVLIALRRTCESGAGLIKAGAAESLPVANESCHVRAGLLRWTR